MLDLFLKSTKKFQEENNERKQEEAFPRKNEVRWTFIVVKESGYQKLQHYFCEQTEEVMPILAGSIFVMFTKFQIFVLPV